MNLIPMNSLFRTITGDMDLVPTASQWHLIWLDKGELSAILNNLRLNPLYTSNAALRIWDNKY